MSASAGRRLVLAAAFAGALAAASPIAAAATRAQVRVMVVGRTRILAAPRSVAVTAATVSVGGRRCAVGAATPLAALAAVRRSGGPAFSLRDYGHCSRAPRDAQSLFVSSIAGDRNAGRDGWVYKVGERTGSTGAASLSGAFGDGRRLRAGQRVLWFWCVMGPASCQRTLEVAGPGAPVAPGAPVNVTVSGFDDQGRGLAIPGATVTLGAASAMTDAAGRATLAAPAPPGAYALSAGRAGLVPAFPETVLVR